MTRMIVLDDSVEVADELVILPFGSDGGAIAVVPLGQSQPLVVVEILCESRGVMAGIFQAPISERARGVLAGEEVVAASWAVHRFPSGDVENDPLD